MREIKFRLRDKNSKIVGYEKWYVGHWHTEDPDRGFSIDSGWWEASPCWLYSVDGKYWNLTYISHRYKDQYTGLKDKNGVEIYEGDIFRQKGMDGEIIVGTIVFYDDLSYRCREGDFIFHKVKFAGEIIGNIYENPELLEDK